MNPGLRYNSVNSIWAHAFFHLTIPKLYDFRHRRQASGKTSINWSEVFQKPGERHVVCYWNTRSYWPTAYDPETNSLYVSYIDNCRDLTLDGPAGRGSWTVIPRPGSDPHALTGLAKINLATGEILRFDIGRAPGNGAMLATAGGLIFHGDMSRRFPRL